MLTSFAAWTAAHFPSITTAFDSMTGFFANLPCGDNTCVDVYEKDNLIWVRSTRRLDAAHIPFDGDEWVKFIDEVKAGQWDGTYAAAVRLKAQMQSA